nr:GNAT family N-acetyltransferase [Lysobacter silvestris]
MITLKANWSCAIVGDKHHFLVKALRNKIIIGRAHGWFAPNAAFVLEKIELSHRYRSRGYGTAIVEELRLKARANGCSTFVFSGVRPDNSRAIKLYESFNAVPSGNPGDTLDYVITPP